MCFALCTRLPDRLPPKALDGQKQWKKQIKGMQEYAAEIFWSLWVVTTSKQKPFGELSKEISNFEVLKLKIASAVCALALALRTTEHTVARAS